MGLKLHKARVWIIGSKDKIASQDVVDRFCRKRNITEKEASHFSRKYKIPITFGMYSIKVTRKLAKKFKEKRASKVYMKSFSK